MGLGQGQKSAEMEREKWKGERRKKRGWENIEENEVKVYVSNRGWNWENID